MTDNTPMHSPTPEFRAALERDLIDALHRESRFREPVSRSFLKRFSIAAALAAGMVLGVGGDFALGQVERSRDRSEQEAVIASKRSLAGIRLELARTNFEEARKRFDAGAISRPSLLAAEADLRAAESAAVRLNLDLEEVRATAAAPRDELWAPIVGGRDFVKDRLSADAAAVQHRVRSLEDAAAEAERGFNVGSVTQLARGEAVSVLAQARGELDLIAQKLMLRRRFIDEHLAPEEVTRQLQQLELASRMDRVQQQARVAQEREKFVRERHTAGAASRAELLRAQVDLMELAAQLEQLRLQLQRVKR